MFLLLATPNQSEIKSRIKDGHLLNKTFGKISQQQKRGNNIRRAGLSPEPRLKIHLQIISMT
jgi:hypothetical protein